jgi:hypothetical protein
MPWIKIAHNREQLVDDRIYDALKDLDVSKLLRELDAKGSSVPAVHSGRRLTEHERLAVFIQTGREMETRSDLNRWCRAQGRRLTEPGELDRDIPVPPRDDFRDPLKAKKTLTKYMGRGNSPDRSVF